jgi:hypothetical protein
VYLVDTNIWLERLLNQERSEEVGYSRSTIRKMVRPEIPRFLEALGRHRMKGKIGR